LAGPVDHDSFGSEFLEVGGGEGGGRVVELEIERRLVVDVMNGSRVSSRATASRRFME
jgi:hypothetical protein